MVRQDEKGRESLWLRHLPTNSNTQVIPPVRLASYDGAQFSPDGNYIYFRRSGGGDDAKRFDLYRVAVLGGTASRLHATSIHLRHFLLTGSGWRFCEITIPQ